MTLPISRDYTAAMGGQALSASYNRVQDCIVQGAHDVRRIDIGVANGDGTAIGAYDLGGYRVPSGAGEWHIPIEIPAGERIVRLHVEGDGTGNAIQVQLAYISASALVTVGAASAALGAGAGSTVATVDLNHTLVAGRKYIARILYNAAGGKVDGVGVEFDKPLV